MVQSAPEFKIKNVSSIFNSQAFVNMSDYASLLTLLNATADQIPVFNASAPPIPTYSVWWSIYNMNLGPMLMSWYTPADTFRWIKPKDYIGQIHFYVLSSSGLMPTYTRFARCCPATAGASCEEWEVTDEPYSCYTASTRGYGYDSGFPNGVTPETCGVEINNFRCVRRP